MNLQQIHLTLSTSSSIVSWSLSIYSSTSTMSNSCYTDLDLNKQQLKELLYEEVLTFVPCIWSSESWSRSSTHVTIARITGITLTNCNDTLQENKNVTAYINQPLPTDLHFASPWYPRKTLRSFSPCDWLSYSTACCFSPLPVHPHIHTSHCSLGSLGRFHHSKSVIYCSEHFAIILLISLGLNLDSFRSTLWFVSYTYVVRIPVCVKQTPDGECEKAIEFVHSSYVLAWLESKRERKVCTNEWPKRCRKQRKRRK